MADFIDDVIRHYLPKHAPELTPAQRQAIELDIRRDRGGTELGYGAKRPAWQNAVKIGESLRQHKPLAQIYAEAGITKRHAYRILSAKGR